MTNTHNKPFERALRAPDGQPAARLGRRSRAVVRGTNCFQALEGNHGQFPMKLHPFDESEAHREIVPYDKAYREIFRELSAFIESKIDSVELFHIGSTAIPDLRGKPMVDIAAVSTHKDLRAEQERFERLGFHRRNVWVDRDDKPYVCGSVEVAGLRFNINIHICRRNDPVHRDSLEFIEILTNRPDLRRKYEKAKDRAHSVAPMDPEAYNREKAAIVHEIHQAYASQQ